MDRKYELGTKIHTCEREKRESEREGERLWSLSHLNHEWKERQVIVEVHKALNLHAIQIYTINRLCVPQNQKMPPFLVYT